MVVTSQTGVGLLATLVEKVEVRFVELLDQGGGGVGKAVNNFLSFVYQLKIIGKHLLYDVIDMLVHKGDDEINEKRIELLLMVLKKVCVCWMFLFKVLGGGGPKINNLCFRCYMGSFILEE